jgi:hypothetical protein
MTAGTKLCRASTLSVHAVSTEPFIYWGGAPVRCGPGQKGSWAASNHRTVDLRRRPLFWDVASAENKQPRERIPAVMTLAHGAMMRGCTTGPLRCVARQRHATRTDTASTAASGEVRLGKHVNSERHAAARSAESITCDCSALEAESMQATN